MNRYIYDKRGFLIATLQNLTKFHTFPNRSTLVLPPSLGPGEFAQFNGDSWVVVNEKPVDVPQIIELKRFKLALLDADLLDTVTAHVAGLPSGLRKRVQIELDNGGEITLEQAKTLLDGIITDNEIEAAFIAGG